VLYLASHRLFLRPVSFLPNFQYYSYPEYPKAFDGNSIGDFAANAGVLHALVPITTNLPPEPLTPQEAQKYPEYQSMLIALMRGSLDKLMKEDEEKTQMLMNDLVDTMEKLRIEMKNEMRHHEEDKKALLDEIQGVREELHRALAAT